MTFSSRKIGIAIFHTLKRGFAVAIYSLKFRAVHASCVTHSTETAQLLAHATSQLPTPGFVLTERERVALALIVERLNNT